MPEIQAELTWAQVHAFRLERQRLTERAPNKDLGWISAVVLVDGQVAGTWTHDVVKETLRLTLAPFRRLSSKAAAEVRGKAGSLAETLGLARAEVRIA
ncbi:MAG: DNA glycosylase AlkZ-like family protein [Candidatus Dormibacteraceae bacterium]